MYHFFNKMPPEITTHIFSIVLNTNPSDSSNISETCTLWHALSKCEREKAQKELQKNKIRNLFQELNSSINEQLVLSNTIACGSDLNQFSVLLPLQQIDSGRAANLCGNFISTLKKLASQETNSFPNLYAQLALSKIHLTKLGKEYFELFKLDKYELYTSLIEPVKKNLVEGYYYLECASACDQDAKQLLDDINGLLLNQKTLNISKRLELAFKSAFKKELALNACNEAESDVSKEYVENLKEKLTVSGKEFLSKNYSDELFSTTPLRRL